MVSQLIVARMSYAAALISCVAYGFYLLLTGISLHFLLKRRDKGTFSNRILLWYIVVMFVTTTVYFLSNAAWSEQEFIEHSMSPGAFAEMTSNHLGILRNTALCINMWLADSLILYRVFVLWGKSIYVVAFPLVVYTGSIISSIGLIVTSAQPGAELASLNVRHFGIAFWSLTVTLNLMGTSLIAGRLLYHQRRVKILRAATNYTSTVSTLVESAACYSITGLIYIPLFARYSPMQYPISALFYSSSSVAPGLIVLRMALGVAASEAPKTTMTNIGFSSQRSEAIQLSAGFRHPTQDTPCSSHTTAPIKSLSSISESKSVEDVSLEHYPAKGGLLIPASQV